MGGVGGGIRAWGGRVRAARGLAMPGIMPDMMASEHPTSRPAAAGFLGPRVPQTCTRRTPRPAPPPGAPRAPPKSGSPSPSSRRRLCTGKAWVAGAWIGEADVWIEQGHLGRDTGASTPSPPRCARSGHRRAHQLLFRGPTSCCKTGPHARQGCCCTHCTQKKAGGEGNPLGRLHPRRGQVGGGGPRPVASRKAHQLPAQFPSQFSTLS